MGYDISFGRWYEGRERQFFYDNETVKENVFVGNNSTLPDSTVPHVTQTDLYTALDGFEGYFNGEAIALGGTKYWFDDSIGISAGSPRSSLGGATWNLYTRENRLTFSFSSRNGAYSAAYNGSKASGVWGFGSIEPDFGDEIGIWTASLRMPDMPTVPIPATLPLFLLGLTGLFFMARKTKT